MLNKITTIFYQEKKNLKKRKESCYCLFRYSLVIYGYNRATPAPILYLKKKSIPLFHFLEILFFFI